MICDHEGPHVHLAGGGFDVLIWLETLESEGVWPVGVKNEVMDWITAHRDELMEEWERWHR